MILEKLAYLFPAGTDVDVWCRDGDDIERIFEGKTQDLKGFGCYQVLGIEAVDEHSIRVNVC